MAESRDEWIKERAYALWESEGYPTGKDSFHWEQASKEREALESSAASSDGKEVKSKVKRAAPKAAAGTNGSTPPPPAKKPAAKKVAAKAAL